MPVAAVVHTITSPHHAAFGDRSVVHPVASRKGGPRRRETVIQHVREKFTCRDCEKISQAPAPFHVIPRGWAGPSLLAMILF
jgi:transposase